MENEQENFANQSSEQERVVIDESKLLNKIKLLVIAIVVILIIGGGAYLYLNKNNNVLDEDIKVVENSEEQNWDTYTNEEYRYSLQYPSDWTRGEEQQIIGGPNKIYSTISFNKDDKKVTISVNGNEWLLKHETSITKEVVIDGQKYTAYIFPNGYECYGADNLESCSFYRIPIEKDGLWYELGATGYIDDNLEGIQFDILSTFEFIDNEDVTYDKKISSKEDAFKLVRMEYLGQGLTLNENYVAELNLNNDELVDYVGVYYNEDVFDSKKQVIIFNVKDSSFEEIETFDIPDGYDIEEWNINNSNFYSNNSDFKIRLVKKVKVQTGVAGLIDGFEFMDVLIDISDYGNFKVEKSNYPFTNIDYGTRIELDGRSKTDIEIDPSFSYYDRGDVYDVYMYTLEEGDIGNNSIAIGSISDGIDLSKIWNIYIGKYRLSVPALSGKYKDKYVVSPEISFVFPKGISEELFSMPAYIEDYYYDNGFLWVDYREGDNTPATSGEGYGMRLSIAQTQEDYDNWPPNLEEVKGEFDYQTNKWKIDTSKVEDDTYNTRLVGWCQYHSNFYMACARRYPLIVGLSPQVYVSNVTKEIINN